MNDNERIARGSVLSIISELDSRDAELERLRQKLTNPCYTALWDETEKNALLAKEIERLREGCLARHADQRAKAEEIERLAKQLQDTVVDAEIIQQARLDAEARADRLREEQRKDYKGMREFPGEYIDASREIEWLREALRDVVDYPWDYNANRVRKALGDE